ncbi:MAG TPA: VWA domain-containing protein, partial [Oceanithermus sp.]|nr:VWA domain-containing protein [Oceanithermus sp.]
MFQHPWVLFLLPLALLARGGLRKLAVFLLLLAAAGPAPPLAPGLTVVLLDQSPSAREATRKAARALEVEGPVRYLAFAERAAWVKSPHAQPPLGEATDLAAAFEAARAARPARILLLSDGLFTPAPPPAPVYAYPLKPSPHAALLGVVAPPLPTAGETVEVRARVLLTRPTEATLRFRAGKASREVKRRLPAGTSSVGFRFVLEDPVELRVELETPFGRDAYTTHLAPAGRMEVLVIGDPAAARYLEAQGLAVKTARRLPPRLPRVVVIGASAEALGPLALDRLKNHLAEGGGLLFTATPEGLFFGGWHRAFEDLPLRPKPTKGAAFVLVLDVSGSMAGEKLARAVEGARTALEAAREEDTVGILVFNERARWLLPPAPASYHQRRLAEERLNALRAVGGTRLAPALAAAREALISLDAAPKAVLVVTDGETAGKEAALAEAEAAARAGVQVHALALGADADRAFLQRLAEQGQGRYAEADPAALARAIA